MCVRCGRCVDVCVKIMGKTAAIAHNLGQTRRLLEEVAAGTSKYDIIRLSA